MKIVGLQSDLAVSFASVALVEGPLERMKGLLGRENLPAGQVMWIRPCASIHTFFMRFSIDVVFLSRDLVVTDVRMGIKPWRAVVGALGSHSVLEMQTGWIDATSITRGVQFKLTALDSVERK